MLISFNSRALELVNGLDTKLSDGDTLTFVPLIEGDKLNPIRIGGLPPKKGLLEMSLSVNPPGDTGPVILAMVEL